MDSDFKQRGSFSNQGKTGANHDVAYIGPNNIHMAHALAFLQGRGKLTQSALLGLHKAVVVPSLITRIIKASEAGARLAAGVNPGGKTLRQIIHDPAFDWGPD